MRNKDKCTYSDFSDKVAILVSKKKCLIGEQGVIIKKGVNPKNAIIKLKGNVVPKEINVKIYNAFMIGKSCVEHIPFYEPKS